MPKAADVVAVAVTVVAVFPVLVARVQLPSVESSWKYIFLGCGAVGEYVDVAVRVKVGELFRVALPTKVLVDVLRGMAFKIEGVINVADDEFLRETITRPVIGLTATALVPVERFIVRLALLDPSISPTKLLLEFAT